MPTDYKKIADENIKKYGTDIRRYGPVLLAHLYSDRTHFIYEILQNAEDAGARAKKSVRIDFHLFNDRLEIRHNGKLFDEPDVRGICGLVEGTKKDDLTQIGKFGIGFKSVYAYTETPRIYSGDETFCIENYVQPQAIEKTMDIKDDETLFIFPFNHEEVLPEEAFNEVSKRLREIGARTLLFLHHIEEIIWHVEGQESGNYIRDIKQGINHKKVYVISKIGEQTVKDEEWLILERPLQLSITAAPNLKVEVAFKIEKDKNNKEVVVPAKDSKLIVFFPTEKPTYLDFLIQGPYRTTPNRENIPSENKQNKTVIRETAELVSQSISIIKELGYLDINFLNALPLESKHCENEPIYDHIFQKVKEKFLGDEELLPTHDGRFAKAKDVLLARGKELVNLFDGDDINFLFEKRCWIDTSITEADRTRELWNYLTNEIQVKQVEFKDFSNSVTAEFFVRKNDEWMIKFYNSLLEQSSLWELKTPSHKSGVLRGKPIIRLEDNSHIEPFNELGEIQAYLPTGYKSEYPIVKQIFIENEGALDFLKKLGLRRPDLFDEIMKFTLPKYNEQKPVEDEYLKDFEKVLTFYNETDSKTKQEELVLKTSETPFILSSRDDFKHPREIYLNSPELKQYFDGYHSAYFVSHKLCEKFTEERLKPFLIKLGVEDKPRRIKIDANLSDKEKQRLRGGAHYFGDEYENDYEYEGLEDFINEMTIEKSCLLWRLLLKNIGTLKRWEAEGFFQGEYCWYYHFGHTDAKKYDSKFLKILKQQAWLVDRNNNFRKASDIILSELPNDYCKESPNIDILKKVLGFKIDIFDQLPEDTKYKLKLTEGRSPEELKEALALLDKKKESETKDNDVWTPECEPAGVDIKIVDISPIPPEPPQLEDQAGELSEGKETKGDDAPKGKESEKTKELPLVHKKAIGKWGEEYVFNAFKKRFEKDGEIEDTDFGFRFRNNRDELIEVFWLNMKSDKGKGYDLVIKANNEENEYIEVKSKLDKNPELVEITETQFEFARKLNDEGKGGKYWIYVVENAGKTEAKIKRFNNPVKLWKDGKLRAHPVHFRL